MTKKPTKKKQRQVSVVLQTGTGRILGVFTSNTKCIKALQDLRTVSLIKNDGHDYARINFPLNEIQN